MCRSSAQRVVGDAALGKEQPTQLRLSKTRSISQNAFEAASNNPELRSGLEYEGPVGAIDARKVRITLRVMHVFRIEIANVVGQLRFAGSN